jgi:hypothetical protein
MSQAERERKIQDFAESQGWIAAIQAGFAMRAIFEKAEPSTGAVVDLIPTALPVRSPLTLTLFASAFFSRRQDRELPGAISRGLLGCPCRA